MAEKIGDAILELRTDVRKLTQGMEKARKSADKTMKKMETRADKFAKFMKSAAGLGGLAIAFASVARAMKKVFEIGQFAAAQKQVSMAFKSIAEDSGAMASDIIKNMRRMSGETISELDMMLSANRASLLGIPVDEFDNLMAIARASATATGESVQKMFDDIVKGIGRASPLILDNLGILIDVTSANDVYAKSIGKAVSELTDAEKKQAFMNATLVAGEEIIRKVGEAGQTLTDVERWQQVTAAASDFKGELGMGLLPIMGNIFEATTKILRKWTDASTAAREYNELMREGLDSNRSAAEQISILAAQLEKMRKDQITDRVGAVNKEEIKAIEDKIAKLEIVAKYEELARQQRAKGDNEAAKASEAKAQAAADELEWLQIINAAYADTDEGRAEVLQAQIEMFERMSEDAVKTLPMFDAVLNKLYDQRDGIEEVDIALEEQMSSFDALAIAAAELRIIEKEADEAKTQALKEQLAIRKQIANAVVDTAIAITSSLSQIWGNYYDGLLENENLSDQERKQIQHAAAVSSKKFSLFEATITGAQAIIAGFATKPFLPVGLAMGALASALAGFQIAAIASTPIPALATGGDFETRGPQMIMVGDNPGGRERVSVTPTSSPNVNGPGQMMHIIVNLGSHTLYDDISRATENGELIIAPRSIRR